jgi:UDP-N-acetylmuramate--alanine ligase
VGGTHGKTTTASMAVHALIEGGRDPGFLIGGEVRPGGGNAGWGRGDWAVIEADESDRSFLKLARDVAVVLNVELDHHSTYRSRHELDDAFAEFGAHARVRWLGPGVPSPGDRAARDRRFGIEEGDLSAREVRLERLGSRFLADDVEVVLGVPGAYNVLNALAALAACAEAGVPLAEAASALRTFTGAKRRFERRGVTADGAEVFDDYAHHPTEVRATLEAARTLGADRVLACFQPHLYSRTRHLAREFGRALALADLVVVLDVYPARERAEDYPGVSGLSIARAAADAAGGRPVYWAPRMGQAEAVLRAHLGPGDALLTLGAGDVDRLAAALVEDEEAPAPREEASLPAA